MSAIQNFQDFIFEKKIVEKKGISPAIYKDLKSYFSSTSKPTLRGAQKFIMDKKGGWKLSAEDFEEAKKAFGK